MTLECQHLRRGSQPPTLLQGVCVLRALRRRLSDGCSGVRRGRRQVRLLLRCRLPLLRWQQLPGRGLEERCILPADPSHRHLEVDPDGMCVQVQEHSCLAVALEPMPGLCIVLMKAAQRPEDLHNPMVRLATQRLMQLETPSLDCRHQKNPK